MHGDGDGWAYGPDGVRHWGRFGAAGLLVRAPLGDAGPAVLLQHRAQWSHQGGTWGLPGGARDSHESATAAALREAFEEAGLDETLVRVRAERVTTDIRDVWSYTTVVADSEALLKTVANRESLELRWVPEAEVELLPLHTGFAASWPLLRAEPVRVLAPPPLPRAGARTVVLPGGGFGWLTGIEELTGGEGEAAGRDLTAVVGGDAGRSARTVTLPPSALD
ncbi:NUDIX hydrolase [Rhodococcus rhodnii]|uniref:NTP pyrophosphohydrolase n=2 Tax=Rhodococcus rhodnii TaxID=38312 RepID=R7WRS8_9NOCA|nr:NUDIX hydrolase [Rhodococcus rhodnii]EOM77985.1 NTP pyrophosphohydrolase [Rhodococcus rhodnii LMG 5362]TXG92054.1 NUDIX hydrolase [Rhodococcus rhodnii]